MNTNKVVAALVAALSVGSSFAVTMKTNDNVICITGSTAFRKQAANALDANYNGTNNWTRVAYTSDGTLSDQKSTGRLYAQTPTTNGTIVTRNFIAVRWTGSEGGLQTIAAPAGKYNVGFLPLSANGSSYTTADMTRTNGAVIAFSDVNQKVSRFLKTGAKNDGVTDAFATLPAPAELGVLSFAWAGSSNFPTAAANITKDIAVELFNNGSVPLSRFTGDSNDATKTVYLIGRNKDSGTRTAALLNAGLPNTATIKQYAVSAVDAAPAVYADETINGLVSLNGTSGYGSGSGVATALGNLRTSTTVYAVGYLGKGDIDTTKNVLLKYEGQTVSPANIASGNYPFWTVENLYQPKTLSPKVCGDTALAQSVYNTLRDTIKAYDVTGLGGNNVPLSSMTVQRSVDGGATSAK